MGTSTEVTLKLGAHERVEVKRFVNDARLWHPGSASTASCAWCSTRTGVPGVVAGPGRVQASGRAAERDPARRLVQL